jgi:hypothetical protein
MALLLLALSLGCGGTKSRLLDDGRYVPASWQNAPIQSPGRAGATRPLRYDAIYLIAPFSSPTQYGATFDLTRRNMDYYASGPAARCSTKPATAASPTRAFPLSSKPTTSVAATATSAATTSSAIS